MYPEDAHPPPVADSLDARFDYGAHALKETHTALSRAMPVFFVSAWIAMAAFLVGVGLLS